MNAKIYKIVNDINDKNYVGQTYQSIEKRFDRHCSEARWRNTKKMPIVLAIKKYGREHFRVELLEALEDNVAQSIVDAKEVEWGMRLNCLSPNGYNLKLGRGKGTVSNTTRRRISIANRGRRISEETRHRLSISHLGHANSDDTRRKLSDAFRGKPPHKNTTIGASRKNSKSYILKSPTGVEVVVENMRRFCADNDLNRSRMSNLVQGKLSNVKGWTLIKDLGFNNINRS